MQRACSYRPCLPQTRIPVRLGSETAIRMASTIAHCTTLSGSAGIQSSHITFSFSPFPPPFLFPFPLPASLSPFPLPLISIVVLFVGMKNSKKGFALSMPRRWGPVLHRSAAPPHEGKRTRGEGKPTLLTPCCGTRTKLASPTEGIPGQRTGTGIMCRRQTLRQPTFTRSFAPGSGCRMQPLRH